MPGTLAMARQSASCLCEAPIRFSSCSISVNALEGLKRVRVAHGQEWPDTLILRANGIDVITSPRYESLFKMLVSERFDYFPRSINEIWDELERHAGTLQVESRVALHYYYDACFMVNKNCARLAEDIREGLERAVADGSFDRLFNEYHGELLRKARLDQRIVIEPKNPLPTPGRADRAGGTLLSVQA